MNRSTKISLVIAILILLVGGTVLAYRAGWLWENAEQRKVRELKTQLASTLKDQKSFGVRRQFFESVREQVSSLPEKYQQQFRDSARNMFRSDFEQRIDEYFKMSLPERKKELDRRIKEMEKMRQQFEQRQAQQAKSGSATAQAGGPGANPPAGGPPPGGPRRGGGPFGGPPGGRGGLSGMLDNSTPEFRAKMSAIMRDTEQRRKELGLPPMGPLGRR